MNLLRAMLSAQQIKAARALIGWSQGDLAQATNLSITTIRKLELGHISPRHTTSQEVRRALEAAGLEFTENDGLRRRTDEIVVFRGPEGLENFFEEIHQDARKNGGELLVVARACDISSALEASEEGRLLYSLVSLNEKIKVRCLLMKPLRVNSAPPRFQCRHISKHYVEPCPYYVFQDKYAIIVPDACAYTKVFAIRSHVTAQAQIRLFDSMWEKATPIHMTEEPKPRHMPVV